MSGRPFAKAGLRGELTGRDFRGKSEVGVVEEKCTLSSSRAIGSLLSSFKSRLFGAFLGACPLLTWPVSVPVCLPQTLFLLLLMFCVTLKTVLWTRNFRHVSLGPLYALGNEVGLFKSYLLVSSFQIQGPFVQKLILSGAKSCLPGMGFDFSPFFSLLEKRTND